MRELSSDLKRLSGMAFGRLKHCGPLLKRFHALASEIDRCAKTQSGLKNQIQNRKSLPREIASVPHISHGAKIENPNLIWRVYDWLLVPFMLWPIDFEGLAGDLLQRLQHGENLDQRFYLLLESIAEPPPETTQRAVAEFERDVESGRYDEMLKQREKYEEAERALMNDDDLMATWRTIKQNFDVTKFQNRRGVIRRRVSGERNFRENWNFDWTDERNQFQTIFDALCYRWNLYDMEHDRPILLKISVNPTRHGTIILIPRHWSLDPRRDLDGPSSTSSTALAAQKNPARNTPPAALKSCPMQRRSGPCGKEVARKA